MNHKGHVQALSLLGAATMLIAGAFLVRQGVAGQPIDNPVFLVALGVALVLLGIASGVGGVLR